MDFIWYTIGLSLTVGAGVLLYLSRKIKLKSREAAIELAAIERHILRAKEQIRSSNREEVLAGVQTLYVLGELDYELDEVREVYRLTRDRDPIVAKEASEVFDAVMALQRRGDSVLTSQRY